MISCANALKFTWSESQTFKYYVALLSLELPYHSWYICIWVHALYSTSNSHGILILVPYLLSNSNLHRDVSQYVSEALPWVHWLHSTESYWRTVFWESLSLLNKLILADMDNNCVRLFSHRCLCHVQPRRKMLPQIKQKCANCSRAVVQLLNPSNAVTL